MRRVLLVAVCVAMSLPAGARTVSRPASTFYATKAILNAGDEFRIDCVWTLDADTVFRALAVTESDGKAWLRWLAAGGTNYPVVYLERPPEGPSPFGGDASGYSGVARYDGDVLRAAWASWSGSNACMVTVNGVALAAEPQPLTNATYVRVRDFDGAVVDAAFVSATPEATFSYRMSGFAFAMLRSDGLTPATMAEMQGPEGQRYAGRGSATAAELTDGEWRFRLANSVLILNDPVLWIMQLPQS